MKRYFLSKPAERDLDQIKAYLLAEAGPAITRRVLREIKAGIRFIASRPLAGHTRQELTDEAFRFWPVFSYLVIYDPAKRPIEVVRIIHGARDITNDL